MIITERVFLTDDKVNYIDTYVYSDDRIKPMDAILVIPGGGYGCVCSDREGEPIALAFASRGVNAFVLNYHTGNGQNYPTQLLDAARAVAYIKENAAKYHIDPDRVFVVGFSAGGHLAGSVATMYEEAEDLLGYERKSVRPHGVIMAYPVVSAYSPTHNGSFVNLLGKDFALITDSERERFSIEKRVSASTPPAFIWHTAEDKTVPIHGSLNLIKAYLDAGVAVEAHVYPYGPHGLALADETTSVANPEMIQKKAQNWVNESIKWMKTV